MIALIISLVLLVLQALRGLRIMVITAVGHGAYHSDYPQCMHDVHYWIYSLSPGTGITRITPSGRTMLRARNIITMVAVIISTVVDDNINYSTYCTYSP